MIVAASLVAGLFLGVIAAIALAGAVCRRWRQETVEMEARRLAREVERRKAVRHEFVRGSRARSPDLEIAAAELYLKDALQRAADRD